LAQGLHDRFGDRYDLLIQNPSVNGNTTRMALERMPYDVQSHSPHILYVQFGMNDCNVWESDRGCPRTSPTTFAANLAEIVDRGRAFGAREIILGTNHPTTRTTAKLPSADHTYEHGNRSYNAITRKVVVQKNTRLADAEIAFDVNVKQGSSGYADLVLADGLHLSRRGHDLYLLNRLPILIEAVAAISEKPL
jgi:lysophospholipase L1-like esterase